MAESTSLVINSISGLLSTWLHPHREMEVLGHHQLQKGRRLSSRGRSPLTLMDIRDMNTKINFLQLVIFYGSLLHVYSSSFFSVSSFFRRFRFHLFSCLFVVSSFFISLGLRPISVASKKSRIGLITFSILKSLFLGLSSLIFGRSIISRARLL